MPLAQIFLCRRASWSNEEGVHRIKSIYQTQHSKRCPAISVSGEWEAGVNENLFLSLILRCWSCALDQKPRTTQSRDHTKTLIAWVNCPRHFLNALIYFLSSNNIYIYIYICINQIDKQSSKQTNKQVKNKQLFLRLGQTIVLHQQGN